MQSYLPHSYNHHFSIYKFQNIFLNLKEPLWRTFILTPFFKITEEPQETLRFNWKIVKSQFKNTNSDLKLCDAQTSRDACMNCLGAHGSAHIHGSQCGVKFSSTSPRVVIIAYVEVHC